MLTGAQSCQKGKENHYLSLESPAILRVELISFPLTDAMRKAFEYLGLVADSHLGVYVGKVLLRRVDADGKRLGNLVA